MSTADNKLKLCGVSSDTDASIATPLDTLSSSFQSDVDVDNSFTIYKNPVKKLITMRKETTPCRGQGDESGNSIMSTPDSTSRYKNLSHDIVEKSSILLDEDQYKLGDSTQLTYTTLLPKQQTTNTLDSLNYSTPINYFQFSQPLPSPILVKSKPCLKTPQMSLNQAFSQSPSSPMLYQRGRGQRRQRRPRQAFYQYRGPIMHSTPTSSSSSGMNDNSPLSPLESTSNSSISSYNESQPSLDYPRVPNNTPNSGEIIMDDKKKVFDIQWIPQIQSQIAEYDEMDPREMHNEKERKRRLRIKTSCQIMKSLLPGVYSKTDNATVFEHSVQFIRFMRECVMANTISCSDYDLEYLHQA